MCTAILTLLLLAGSPADAWTALTALVGNWEGVGSGSPGQAAGGFSLAYDLDNRVLVRRSQAAFPATAQRPAFTHTDLMIIYRDPSSGRVRADYWDNEDHLIHYDVSVDTNRIIFTSDHSTGPRFRLIYTTGPADIGIAFEMAPPASPDAFRPYLQSTARRARN